MKDYIMITPVKNEQKHIRATIDSVLKQSELPKLWVIIDGGSTDKTRDVVKEYITKYPWINLVHQLDFLYSDDAGHTNVSYAVTQAYRYALKYCYERDMFYDYVWTVDGDQILLPDVCAGIIAELEKNKGVGAASGLVLNGETPDVYPKGELPNKRVYRRVALDSIDGFQVTKYSYDTVALAKLRVHNWEIQSFPEYRILNLRPDSGIERNEWRSSVQFGKARYYLGYSFLLTVMGCGYLVMQRKVGKAFGIFYGYLASLVNRDEVISDKEVRNHFHYDRIKEVLRK